MKVIPATNVEEEERINLREDCQQRDVEYYGPAMELDTWAMDHPGMTASTIRQDQPDPGESAPKTRRWGTYARRILLLAPQPDQEAQVVPPEDARSARSMGHYRAMRHLEEEGLISSQVVDTLLEVRRSSTTWEWNRVLGEWVEVRTPTHRQRRRRRAVKLTPRGAALVEEMRPIWQRRS